jgi:hypothetical protein
LCRFIECIYKEKAVEEEEENKESSSETTTCLHARKEGTTAASAHPSLPLNAADLAIYFTFPSFTLLIVSSFPPPSPSPTFNRN